MLNKVTIINKDNFRTVVSSEKINKGETIILINGYLKNIPNRYSIQLDSLSHIWPYENSQWQYLNHSCSPNAEIARDGSRKLVAIKEIDKGEEVTFNYNCVEYDMNNPFKCNCGSERCLGYIRGYRWLSKEEKFEIKDCCMPYLKSVTSF